MDPNIASQKGYTALMMAANYDKHDSVVKLLLADKRVDPNIARQRDGSTALSITANYNYPDILELLLEDHRTTRTRPPDNPPHAQAAYDAALRAVKQRRNNRFKGLTRAMVAFRRLRLRAAQAVYAPGGAGFAAAAASFQAAAVGMAPGMAPGVAN